MKNLIRALLFISVISCQQSTTEKAVEEEPYVVTDSAPSMYAVSLESAKKNIDYYDRASKDVLGVDPIRAFTIRSVDVVEAIGMDVKYLKKADYSHLRIYMGLDSATKEFKIYLTPVKGAILSKGKAGKDVILDGPYEGIPDANGEVSEKNGQYMMDFSSPCPKTCPEGGQ